MKFNQGDAPMPEGCICDPFDFAALGHMTQCPCYRTPTGRVPSQPRMQNIPIRTEEGRRIREAFLKERSK